MLTNALPPQVWTLELAAGSSIALTFTFTTGAPGGTTPYPITGAAWEYVVRPTATSSGSPTFSVTTSSSAAGVIDVTSTPVLSQAVLTLNPAATSALTPGAYAHALWQNPGTTSAFTWASGTLMIVGNPAP